MTEKRVQIARTPLFEYDKFARAVAKSIVRVCGKLAERRSPYDIRKC